MAAKYVLETLASFQERKKAIEGNKDLSQQGRQKFLDRLDQEIAEFRPSAHQQLRVDWMRIKERDRDWRALVASEQEKIGAKWDFTRLNYQKEALQQAIRHAGEFTDAVSIYQDAAGSGDEHRKRAAVEFGVLALRDKFGSHDTLAVGDLERAAKKELERLNSSPELEALKETGASIARDAYDLQNATKQTDNFFNSGGLERSFGLETDFSQLLDGVTLKYSVDENLVDSVELIVSE